MRINVKALKRAGIDVTFHDKNNIIEIHPKHFFSLENRMLRNHMKEMGLTPGDIDATMVELQNRIHRISMMNLIDETGHDTEEDSKRGEQDYDRE